MAWFDYIFELFELDFSMRLSYYAYTFFCLIRLFRGFAVQPRLALVTETFRKSFNDLVHFGIVFFTVFVAFAIIGYITFGREMEECWVTKYRFVGNMHDYQ